MAEGNPNMKIVCNVNGTFLLMGHMKVAPKTLPKDKPWGELNLVFLLDRCYLFFTDWNTRHGKYVVGNDIGMRETYPYRIEDMGGGYLAYVNLVPRMCEVTMIDAGERVLIREVYRSGDSVIYKKVGVE